MIFFINMVVLTTHMSVFSPLVVVNITGRLLLLLPMKFIPQWAWVLSNLWYVHSPTRRHVIKNKNVIFTVKTMMWMFTHVPAPPWTLQVWEHLLTLLTSYSMSGLLKGSTSFGGSVFWRMAYLKFLVMASCCSGGCRSKVHLRWYGYKVVDYSVHHYHFCVGSSLL
jgi:hypothetical protein